MTEQIAMTAVAFSFAGMCIGYWLCWEVNKPRNPRVTEHQPRVVDWQEEIERRRKDLARLKRQHRPRRKEERELQLIVAGSL